MAELVEALKTRQGDMRTEVFAVRMGISSSILLAYFRQDRKIGAGNARKMAQYFNDHGDYEMVRMLGSHMLGIDIPPPQN